MLLPGIMGVSTTTLSGTDKVVHGTNPGLLAALEEAEGGCGGNFLIDFFLVAYELQKMELKEDVPAAISYLRSKDYKRRKQI